MRLSPTGYQPSISWSQGPISWSYYIIIIIIIIIIIFHNVLLQYYHALPLDFRLMYLMH